MMYPTQLQQNGAGWSSPSPLLLLLLLLLSNVNRESSTRLFTAVQFSTRRPNPSSLLRRQQRGRRILSTAHDVDPSYIPAAFVRRGHKCTVAVVGGKKKRCSLFPALIRLIQYSSRWWCLGCRWYSSCARRPGGLVMMSEIAAELDGLLLYGSGCKYVGEGTLSPEYGCVY